MKYKTLMPALFLGLSLGGSANSSEPASIVKEYQKERYEITNVEYFKTLGGNKIWIDTKK